MTEAHPSDSREPVTHNLKTWPDAYDAVYAGLKPWEFRKNDRDYRVGDTLRLLRWSPDDQVYTGEEMSRRVSWMLDGGQFGIPDGFCIMSLAALAAPGVEAEPVAWRPDRESVARAMLDLFASLAGPPSWGDTLRAADAILALTAPPAKGGA